MLLRKKDVMGLWEDWCHAWAFAGGISGFFTRSRGVVLQTSKMELCSIYMYWENIFNT